MGSSNRVWPFTSTPSRSSSILGSQLLADHSTTVPGAYSVNKMVAMGRYTKTASLTRVLCALVFLPTLGLACAVLPAFIPLNDPLAGLEANLNYIALVLIVSAFVLVGSMLMWRVSAEIPSHIYSRGQAILVGVIAAILETICSVGMSYFWVFPTPMSWVLVSSTTGTNVALGHLVVFGRRCWRDQQLRDGVKKYVPAFCMQALQIVLYPAFSVLFDHVSPLYQVLLTLVFPLVKFVMKRALQHSTSQLHSFSTETSVSGVEICASLYQSMIMQSAPSQVAMTIIMGVDIVHGLVVVKFFMDPPTVIPQKALVAEALKIIEQSESSKMTHLEQHIDEPTAAINPISLPVADDKQTHTREPSTVSQPSERAEDNRHLILVQALELVDKAEAMLLVEYLEVAIPLMNMVFILVACQLQSTQYNMRLRSLYFNPDQLTQAALSILLYACLQLLSFVAMHLVMKHRYGLSATYLLAFILERHWLGVNPGQDDRLAADHLVL